MGRNGGNTAYALLQRPGGCEGRPNGVRVNLWALGRGGRAFAQAPKLGLMGVDPAKQPFWVGLKLKRKTNPPNGLLPTPSGTLQPP